MPPVFSNASSLRYRLDQLSTAIVHNVLFRAHNVNPFWKWRPGKDTTPQARRSLFELNAGRPTSPLPLDLPLGVTRPASNDDVWFTTSEHLIDALGPVGKDYAKPKKYDWLVDLSYAGSSLADLDRNAMVEKVKEGKQKQELIEKEGRQGRSRKKILVDYLRHAAPILDYRNRLDDPAEANAYLDRALERVFGQTGQGWLTTRGLDVLDVMNWAWILTANTSERAAIRLTLLARDSFDNRMGQRAVPQFVFAFLLRRDSIDGRALRPLLAYAWKLLKDSETHIDTPPEPTIPSEASDHTSKEVEPMVKDGKNGMSEHVFIILIIRLLRRARKVWPSACENIVALLIRYLNGINFRKHTSSRTTLEPEYINHITYVYNTMLRLLSLPSSIHPFLSAVFQQRAQFSVLRRMNEFDPPLHVDKKGYRAIAMMQLMHKKTMKEREWAHMKARSWPPWKEEKLGMDARIGPEDGISRAKQVLRGAEEAGYAPDNWDDASGILSGWDTDGSPTIQTRSIVRYHSLDNPKISDHGAVWAARIQATRTMEEAWSCFLSWRDHTSAANTSQRVYLAMFTKIVHHAYLKSSKVNCRGKNSPFYEEPLSGDGLEVLPAPESPCESVYVRSPPPTMDELLNVMKSDSIKASGRLLTFLISKAPSFEFGVNCLEASILQPSHLAAVFSDQLLKDPNLQMALRSIPTQLFAGIIEFLARFTPSMYGKYGADSRTKHKTSLTIRRRGWTSDLHPHDHTPSCVEDEINPLTKAYQLLALSNSRYRPAWYHLFRALVRPKVVTGDYACHSDQDIQDIQTWRMLCTLLDKMLGVDLHIDLDGFQIICIGLEKAIFASERRTSYRAATEMRSIIHQGKVDNLQDGFRRLEDDVLRKGLPLVKAIFKDAVRPSEMQQTIPHETGAEKSRIDRLMKIGRDKAADFDETSQYEQEDHQPIQRQSSFLPPACLLPKLLETPTPAQLHAFIRVLGLRRDYDGILDLVEWMALYADEIHFLAEEALNGKVMLRRCMTAVRVFLERSWMRVPREQGGRAGYGGIVVEGVDEAPEEVVRAVREVVEENWRFGGWPGEEEVVEYVLRGRFV